MAFQDLTGQRFGRLVAIERAGRSKNRQAMWRCACDCGNLTTVRLDCLKNSNTRSCGCLHDEVIANKRRTHNKSCTRTFHIWQGMKNRCSNPSYCKYHLYGGKGVKVCDRWLESFQNFYDDMGEAPAGMSIDRIDGSGNYEPENCRWATSQQQAENTSRAVLITFNGKTQNRKQWANDIGIGDKTLEGRLKHGWSIEKALTQPVKLKANRTAKP